MTEAQERRPDGGVWVVLPQGVSRLSAVFVFAVTARNVDADTLGTLAIATAVTAGVAAFAPAVVGKPLAVLTDERELRRQAPAAQSFSVLAALLLGVVLATVAVAVTGPARTVLLACAVGVPGAMAVESDYWRTVFLHGRKRGGLRLSAAYLVQALAVTLGALLLGPTGLVLSPFLGLAAAGAVLVALDGGVSWRAGRQWLLVHRSAWLPYVLGVSAAAALAQAIPVVLAVAAGLPASSAYRAGELVFGLTNLLIGVVVQARLTSAASDLRRASWRASVVLVGVAVLNGVVVAVLPVSLLTQVVGPVAEQLRDVLVPFTVLRAALGVASVGGVLLLRHLSARRVGVLGVAAAALSATYLLVGVVLGDLTGALVGLAAAEAVIAAYYVRLLRQRT